MGRVISGCHTFQYNIYLFSHLFPQNHSIVYLILLKNSANLSLTSYAEVTKGGESVVEKIVIRGYNEKDREEALKITFVYKIDIHSICEEILSNNNYDKLININIRTNESKKHREGSDYET